MTERTFATDSCSQNVAKTGKIRKGKTKHEIISEDGDTSACKSRECDKRR